MDDTAMKQVNKIARRGDTSGKLVLEDKEMTVDLKEMCVHPNDRYGMPKALRKVAVRPKVNKTGIKKMYLTFADNDEKGKDAIFGEGMLKFFEYLGVDPATDLVALCLAQQCSAEAMGLFKRTEFIRGMAALGVDTFDQLKAKVPELRERLKISSFLGEVYMYTFGIALEPPSKVLPVDEAVQYWALLLGGWGLCEEWGKWSSEVYKKAVTRDLWGMVFKLATEVPADLSTYDDEPSWPVALDDFVEHVRKVRGG